MQNVVIDTNVIVSAFINRAGIPAQVLEFLIQNDEVQIWVSAEIVHEYDNVFRREKFSRYSHFHSEAELFLNALDGFTEKLNPTLRLQDVLPDDDDHKFLELAVEAKVDFLITGNTSHFPFKIYQGVQIVSPAEYWEKHRP
jgi:putative PIN family toxin of toxin-antitoxin system